MRSSPSTGPSGLCVDPDARRAVGGGVRGGRRAGARHAEPVDAGVAGDFQRFRIRIYDFLVCRRCGILDSVISSTVEV